MRTMMFRLVVGALAALGLLSIGGVITQSAQAADGDVRGSVTAVNGPVDSGYVTFYATCEDYEASRYIGFGGVITGGTYRATQIPNGTYRVLIEPGAGGAMSWHKAKPSCAQADTVTVNGSTAVNLVAGEGFAVSGSVASSNGPVSSGDIEFYATCQDYRNSGGGYSRAIGSGEISGGNYSLLLPEGSYRVRIIPDEAAGAAKSWHNGKASCETADTVAVHGPTTVNLTATAGFTVTGTVASSNGSVTSGTVTLHAACDGGWYGQSSITGGTYTIHGVPPGTHRASINSYDSDGVAEYSWHNSKATCAQADTVTVNGATTANLTATAGYTVTGSASTANGPISSGDAYFYASCQDYNNGDQAGDAYISQGHYSATDIPNGTYRVYIRSGDDGDAWSWHSAKPTCAQADTVTVNGATTANLIASTGMELSGTVSSSKGPVAEGWMHFYRTCEDYETNSYYSEISTYFSRGDYSIDLLPGVYRVLIDPGEGTGAVESWHSAKMACAQATTVTVGATPTTANLVASPGYRVAGTVASSNGPVSDGYVSFYATCQDFLSWNGTGDDVDITAGSYAIDGLPEGTYRIRMVSDTDADGAAWASWHGGTSSCANATTVTISGDATVNLTASPGFTVSGSLTSGTGPQNPTPPPTQPPVDTPPVASTPPPPSQTQTAPQTTTKLAGRVKKGKVAKLPKATQQGVKLSWKSGTKKVCKVKAGKVKALKKGTCKLEASAPATPGFNAYSRIYVIKVK